MLEWLIIGSAWVITLLALLKWVPKDKWRHAWMIMLFQQFVTWGAGLAVVEMRWIEYPTRCFSEANRTSFTFEFFVFPAVTALFNLRYPREAGRFGAMLYYAAYTGGLTMSEVLMEAYTTLIKFTGWAWYWTFAGVWFTLYLSRRYYLWHEKGLDAVRAGVQDGA